MEELKRLGKTALGVRTFKAKANYYGLTSNNRLSKPFKSNVFGM